MAGSFAVRQSKTILGAILARATGVHIILSLPCGEQKRQNAPGVKYWEIIADNLSKAGWSWSCVSAIDSHGRTSFVADAHRDDGKRFVARADEKLTAFVELELACRRLGFAPGVLQK